MRLTDNEPSNNTNRASRRAKMRRSKGQNGSLLSAYNELKIQEERYRRTVSVTPLLTELIYQGDVDIFSRLKAWKKFSSTISNFSSQSPEEQRSFEEMDFYEYPVNGLSLNDIESIPLPLEESGITEISKMFRRKTFLRFFPRKISDQEAIVRDILPIVATLPLAQKGVQIPPEFKGLHDRAKEYFEFGLPYLKELYPDSILESGYMFFMSLNSIHTFAHLFAYMPARLGILPQTAYEMYLAKANIGEYSTSWRFLNRHKTVDVRLTNAFPKDTLISNLVDPSNVHKKDRGSAQAMADSLLFTRVDPRVADEAVDQFAAFRKAFRAEILGSREGVVVIPSDSNSRLFDQVAVTCHGSKASENYRNTLIISVRPKGAQQDIVLEVGKDSSIYGIPYEVLKSNPHAEMVLRKMLLGEISAYCQVKYPTKKTLTEVDAQPTRINPAAISTVLPLAEHLLPSDKVKTKGDVSEKTVIKKVAEVTIKAAYVEYSYSDIKALLGNMRDETVVSRLIATLSRFESTGNGIYELTAAKTRGADLFGLKCGDYRIILSKGENSYSVQAILNRSEYDNKGLNRLIDRFLQSK